MPRDLPAALKEHFSRYFTFTIHLPKSLTSPGIYLPDVVARSRISQKCSSSTRWVIRRVIEGNYDSEKMNLNVNIDIATAAYGGFDIDSLRLK